MTTFNNDQKQTVLSSTNESSLTTNVQAKELEIKTFFAGQIEKIQEGFKAG